MTAAVSAPTAAGVLAGRVAVIAGASRNIGLAVVNRFADEGADVVMVARDEPRLRAAADDVRARTGRQVWTLATDLATLDGAEELIAFTEASCPRVDTLVYSAFFHPTPVGTSLLDISPDDWEIACRAHLTVPFRVSQAMARRMIDGHGGTIVHVGTTGAFLPFPEYSAVYGSTKAGLWHLTRYMANWWAPKVRANMICPGPISKPDNAGLELTASPGSTTGVLHPTFAELVPRIPLGRVGTPSEAAEAALFLASDASSFTTGQVIFLDGGRVGGYR